MKNRKSSLPRPFIAALALAAAVGVAPKQAEACGGGWYEAPMIDYRIQGVARAEKRLEEGQYAQAASAVIRMIPHIAGYKKATRDPIINRALRVLAVATTRSEGSLDIGKLISKDQHSTWLGDTAEDRQANLRFSVAALRGVKKLKVLSDPTLESELGEALALVPAFSVEGRELLHTLAEKDLLTTPEAYAILAKLRGEAGDADGRTAALQRCRAMAKDAKLCSANASGTHS